jgi:predicted CXXCH cytochrome family protein
MGKKEVQEMRKLGLIIIVIAALALVPAASFGASIVGSAHDLSGASWNTSGQICITCHTPHNALTPQLIPLWNHAATNATFTLYESPSLDASPTQPVGVSKACLSCHDGTVALDSYGGATGTNLIAVGSARLGTDLSNDHPISFTWPTTDTGLETPASGKVGTLLLPLFGAGTDQMECASCHAVHDPQYGDFLRASNATSALCLNCHLK